MNYHTVYECDGCGKVRAHNKGRCDCGETKLVELEFEKEDYMENTEDYLERHKKVFENYYK